MMKMAWTDIENNASETSKEKVPYTKFKQGAQKIRIIDDEPFSFWQHWLPKQSTSVVCPGKDCPICNVIKAQKANKETPQYNSTHRHAIRIWNYDTNQMEVLIQGKTFFAQLLTLLKEVGDLRNYDIKVIKSGEGKNTTYTVLPCAASDFEFEDKLSEVNMEDLFAPPEKEVIIQLMEGKTYKEIYGNNEEE